MVAVGARPVPWTPYSCRRAWPVPWAPNGCRGGGAGALGPVWPPLGHGRSPGPYIVDAGVWPFLWAPYGRRRVVAGPVGPVWMVWGRGRFRGALKPPRRRGRSRGPRMIDVEAWPVPFASYGCCEGVEGPVAPYGRLEAWPVSCTPYWLPWGRGQSPGPRMAAVGAWPFSWTRMAAVGAWPVSWALQGCRGVVADPLGLVWPPFRRGRSSWPRRGLAGPLARYGRPEGVAISLGPVWPPWRCGGSRGPRMDFVGAWQLPWPRIAAMEASRTQGSVWLPWGRGPSPGHRMVAVGVWLVSWAPYTRRGGVAGLLGLVWPM